ncbi:hypothetical protein ACN38_g9235 [Penicillium nordicum]|uniref:Uncharacterized protein n=1 Tax=Penicillium nordicum TaxID=229535 RepID=A0A0M8NYK5_9EURO|nr:hypothetical protein ACN38_g9235 [Penicillium nordicum]
MECLEKRGFMLFPSSWFFLNNFNDGIFFLWESFLLRIAVQLACGLDERRTISHGSCPWIWCSFWCLARWAY